MADAFTMAADARYGFAPKPDPEATSLHRIYIVFEGSDGRNICNVPGRVAGSTDVLFTRRRTGR